MNTHTPRSAESTVRRAWTVAILTLLFVAVACLFCWRKRADPFNQPDSDAYILIAQGRISEVHKPFTHRILSPAVAGFVSHTTGLSLEAAFFVTTLTCAAVWVGIALSWILRRTQSMVLGITVIFIPIALSFVRQIYNSDCMQASLLAAFFVALAAGNYWYAMPLLFLAQLARDSTMLFAVTFVLVSVFHRKWKLAAAAILAVTLGIVAVGQVAKQGQGNIHEMNEFVYLAGKLPFNFLNNVCGVLGWTNTLAKYDPAFYSDPPLVKIELPKWLPTGNMHEVGIYKLDPSAPLLFLSGMLTVFGVMPSVALSVLLWRRGRLFRGDELPFIGRLVLVYGAVAFLIGPLTGASYWRLAGHSWPLAWLAAPELLDRYFTKDKRLMVQLAGLQAITCWMSGFFDLWFPTIASCLLTSVAALGCHIVTSRILRQSRIAEVV